ncbi:MAG: tetratricopeptide repeat protein [Alphaproteobacteria bacterium]|nr:tetratricopeptide repeat protein [Alphaproteobacteria bacterium]
MKVIAAFVGVLALTFVLSVGGATAMDTSAAKNSAHPDFGKAVEAIDLKDYQKALTLLANVRQSEPENADAENLTGLSYRMLKDYEMAFSHYQRALQIDPKHKGAHEYLGISYLETNQVEKADDLLESIKKLCAFCAERRSLNNAIKAYKRANKTS